MLNRLSFPESETPNSKGEECTQDDHCVICNAATNPGFEIDRYLLAWSECLTSEEAKRCESRINSRTFGRAQSEWTSFVERNFWAWNGHLVYVGHLSTAITNHVHILREGKGSKVDENDVVTVIDVWSYTFKNFDIKCGRDSYMCNEQNQYRSDDLQSIKECKTKLEEGSASKGPRKDSILFHPSCWEILSTINKKMMKGTELSPFLFRRIVSDIKRSMLYKTKVMEDQMRLEPWAYLGGDCVDLNTFWNDGNAQDQTDKKLFGQAFRKTVKHRSADKQVKDMMWCRLKAWTYFNPDTFPRLTSTIYNGKPLHLEDQSASFTISNLSFLPDELVYQIAMSTSKFSSAIAFSSTCKRMRKIIMPYIDQIALLEIELEHPWMLPVTPREKRENQDLVKQVQITYKSMLVAAPNFTLLWARYMQECLRVDAWHMVNRERIFTNAKYILQDLEQKGYLE